MVKDIAKNDLSTDCKDNRSIRIVLFNNSEIPVWLLESLYYTTNRPLPNLYKVDGLVNLADLLSFLTFRIDTSQTNNQVDASTVKEYYDFVHHQLDKESGKILHCLCQIATNFFCKFDIISTDEKNNLDLQIRDADENNYEDIIEQLEQYYQLLRKVTDEDTCNR
jgi:hypothetical protein